MECTVCLPNLLVNTLSDSIFLEYTFVSDNKYACIGFEGDNRYIAQILFDQNNDKLVFRIKYGFGGGGV